MCALEDLVADVAELQAECTADSGSGGAITARMMYESAEHVRRRFAVAARLHKLIGLSEAMATDQGFARQVRRKFLE